MSHQRSVLVVVTLLVAGALVTTVGGAPPPQGICGVCGAEFERTAEESGVDATVVESQARVAVAANGTAVWTATVTVDRESAREFAANATLRRSVVERTYDSGRTVVDRPRALTVTQEDRTITVRFRQPNATTRTAGVVLFTGFSTAPFDGAPALDADRIVVEGPPGTSATHAPPGVETSEGRAVLTRSEDGSGPRIDNDVTVAFGATGDALAEPTTSVAVWYHGLTRELGTLPLGQVSLAAVVVGALAALLVAGRPRRPAFTTGRGVLRWTGGVTVGIVALAAGAALVRGRVDAAVVHALTVGLGLAPAAVVTAATGGLLGRGRSKWLTARGAAVGLGLWTVGLLSFVPASSIVVATLGSLPFLAGGALAGRGHWSRFCLPAVAALGVVVVALGAFPQVGVVLVSPAVVLLQQVGVALFGVALFGAGHARTASARGRPARRSRTRR